MSSSSSKSVPSYADRMWDKGFLDISRSASEKYPTHVELITGITDYFKWLEEEPLQEEKIFSTRNGIERVWADKARAPSLRGLLVFLGIRSRDWEGWKDPDRVPEPYDMIVEWAENAMFAIKFEKAAVDLLNPSVIIRDLGLKEQKEVSGPNGESIAPIIQYALPDNGRDEKKE